MEITHREDEEGVINAIAPRKNQFIRPPVANVDCFVIVVAAAQPKPVPEVVVELSPYDLSRGRIVYRYK